jgi:8-oxo-dGTP pyrophosphatase MutT (NUDIX family)
MYLSSHHLSAIKGHKPSDLAIESLMQAAVSIIFRDSERGTEFLMMQRAKHEKDPWSGQMSFPGGKMEPQDENGKAAAIRETCEEVGLQLEDSDYLGQLDDFYGFKINNTYNVHVQCYVFKLDREVSLKANHEVADLVWLPLSYLQDSINSHEYYHPHDNRTRMPAIMIDEQKGQILWGISLRMLKTLFELLQVPMSALSDEEISALVQA